MVRKWRRNHCSLTKYQRFMCILSFSLVVSMKLKFFLENLFGSGRSCFYLNAFSDDWSQVWTVQVLNLEAHKVFSSFFDNPEMFAGWAFFALAGLQTSKDAQVCLEWWGVQLAKIVCVWGGYIKGCLKKARPVVQVVLKSQMLGRTPSGIVIVFLRDLILQLRYWMNRAVVWPCHSPYTLMEESGFFFLCQGIRWSYNNSRARMA